MNTLDKKYFLITHYENYNGGTNNLQVSRICEGAAGWTHIKRFTSLNNNAKATAKRWAKRNNYALVSY